MALERWVQKSMTRRFPPPWTVEEHVFVKQFPTQRGVNFSTGCHIPA